jgi:hypothetical protein
MGREPGRTRRFQAAGAMMELICVRLANMKRVHPDQIETACSQCGHIVGVYPSGQALMRQYPDINIICEVCRQPGESARLAPGAEFEAFQSVRKQ